jgi:uncharacterized protein YuzE
MIESAIKLKVSDDDPDIAYLYLPAHPGPGTPNVVRNQVSLNKLIEGYSGPDVYLDFGQNGKLIGIEILV